MRRFTHYDYWQDCLKPSILVDSGADWLCYGMGERTMIEFTRAIESGRNVNEIRKIPQLGFYMDGRCRLKDAVILNSYERCCKDKVAFAENFHIIETYANMLTQPVLVEPTGEGFVQINTMGATLEQASYAYTRLWLLTIVYVVTAVLAIRYDNHRHHRIVV